jgi:CRISPR/Cas system CMR subunit Cmr4 (Cas7 group RAMP superfamily)
MKAGNIWIVCREPVHIGGADSENRGNNNPIFRLPDRTPVIPGSSLRGALREHAEKEKEFQPFVGEWFGGDTSAVSPGNISLGWGWPVWWPVHVLGYGNWWVSFPDWLNRFADLTGTELPPLPDNLLVTEPELDKKTVYLRWLKLSNIAYLDPGKLPLPPELQAHRKRLLILKNESINTLVDMGMVRQPRVSLKENADKDGSLVDNLFSVEGIPPGASFVVSWHSRQQQTENWESFLHREHHLGGLWGVGYGRIIVENIN